MDRESYRRISRYSEAEKSIILWPSQIRKADVWGPEHKQKETWNRFPYKDEGLDLFLKKVKLLSKKLLEAETCKTDAQALTPKPKETLHHLIDRFRDCSTREKIEHLAEEIFDLCSERDKDSISKLRNILSDTTNQYKRACLLQLLAELGDNESAPIFIKEIRDYDESNTDVPPGAPLIVAVTYIRLLKMPEDKKKILVTQIINCVNKCHNLEFPEKTALIAGAIITFRAMGSLEDCTDFLIEFLYDNDMGIVEGSVESLSHVWRRAAKNRETEKVILLDDYRQKISKELQYLLNKYGSQITKEDIITPIDTLLSRTSLFLTQVDPDSSVELLSNLFIKAIEKGNKYLMVSFLKALKTPPTSTNIVVSKLFESSNSKRLLVTIFDLLKNY